MNGLKILHDLGVVVSPTSIIKNKIKTTCKTARKTDYGNSYNVCESQTRVHKECFRTVSYCRA